MASTLNWTVPCFLFKYQIATEGLFFSLHTLCIEKSHPYLWSKICIRWKGKGNSRFISFCILSPFSPRGTLMQTPSTYLERFYTSSLLRFKYGRHKSKRREEIKIFCREYRWIKLDIYWGLSVLSHIEFFIYRLYLSKLNEFMRTISFLLWK
jgi:hypothetical protein